MSDLNETDKNEIHTILKSHTASDVLSLPWDINENDVEYNEEHIDVPDPNKEWHSYGKQPFRNKIYTISSSKPNFITTLKPSIHFYYNVYYPLTHKKASKPTYKLLHNPIKSFIHSIFTQQKKPANKSNQSKIKINFFRYKGRALKVRATASNNSNATDERNYIPAIHPNSDPSSLRLFTNLLHPNGRNVRIRLQSAVLLSRPDDK